MSAPGENHSRVNKQSSFQRDRKGSDCTTGVAGDFRYTFFVTHSENKISNTFYLGIPGERESNTAINDHRPLYLGSEQGICWDFSRKQTLRRTD